MIRFENDHEVRNVTVRSAYFGGGYNDYGLYAWNIKYYGFLDEIESEVALRWALGEFIVIGKDRITNNNINGFETINGLLGRKIHASIEGRSGGWLVIHTELTASELTAVDKYVRETMAALPTFLREEREYYAKEGA